MVVFSQFREQTGRLDLLVPLPTPDYCLPSAGVAAKFTGVQCVQEQFLIGLKVGEFILDFVHRSLKM